MKGIYNFSKLPPKRPWQLARQPTVELTMERGIIIKLKINMNDKN
jgi:hypothetical protein